MEKVREVLETAEKVLRLLKAVLDELPKKPHRRTKKKPRRAK